MKKKIQIQIFGHSIAAGNLHSINNKPFFDTWSDLLLKKYDSENFCNHQIKYTIMPSEERHLLNLKSKSVSGVELAIIFHSHPRFNFMPSCTRDWMKQPINEIEDDVINGLSLGMTITPYSESTLTNITSAEVIQAIESNHRFFHNPELNMNRYYGALIQIDQFCTAKKIPVIHCVLDRKFIPKWFKFSSGIVDYTLASFQRHHLDLDDGTSVDNPYLSSYNKSHNTINEEGNKIIFNKLDSYIQAMIEQNQIITNELPST